MSLALATQAIVIPQTSGDLGLADQGVMYHAGEATPGVTGIVGPVSTTFSEVLALMTVFNGGTGNIYPRYLRLQVRTIGTTGTRVHFTQATDTTNRFTSGGSALTVVNTNMLQPINASGAVVNFGALVTTAAGAGRRIVGNTSFKATAIETVEDTYQLSWGGAGQFDDPASLSNTAAATSNVSMAYAPVCIGPGHTFVIHQWRAAITVGITFGVEFGFVGK